MKTLLLLAVVLATGCALFGLTGLPAIERMQQAHGDLLRREQDLDRTLAELAPVSLEEFSRLGEERDRLAALAEGRRLALSSASRAGRSATLAEALREAELPALRPEDKLTVALQAQAAGSSQADAALAAVVRALGVADGVEVGALELKNDAQLQPVSDVPGLSRMEAQVVLTAGVPEALACLEALAPRRGAGLPALSVLSASLHRLEPDRWGSRLQHFSGPPVRLTVSIAVLLATPEGGAGGGP